MYNDYYPDYLIHTGVKGMKWGIRRYQKKDGSLTSEGKKRYSGNKTVGQKVGRAAVKAIEKSREKAERRNKSYARTTDMFGVGGAAIRSYAEYQNKKFIKGTLANVINASANAYISNNSSKYHISRGVDFARRAAVGGLSMSSRIDQVNAYANVAKSAIYQASK